MAFFSKRAEVDVDGVKCYAMTADELRSSYQDFAQRAASTAAALDLFRRRALASGLGAELRALESPPPRPERPQYKLIRVRGLEAVATQWENRPVAINPRDVLDLPEPLAVTLLRAGLVEAAPADPLFTVRPSGA